MQFMLPKFPFNEKKTLDKLNYLQPLNNDNDLLAAGILLVDDFRTYDVSFKQMVADFFSKYCCSSARSRVHRNQNLNNNNPTHKTKQKTFQDLL